MVANGFALLVVRSVTYAIKGQKILENNGINAYVQRNSAPSSKQGCGYALKINAEMKTAALGLLNGVGISVTEILEV